MGAATERLQVRTYRDHGRRQAALSCHGFPPNRGTLSRDLIALWEKSE